MVDLVKIGPEKGESVSGVLERGKNKIGRRRGMILDGI